MSGRSSAVMFVCMVAIALASNKAQDFGMTEGSGSGGVLSSPRGVASVGSMGKPSLAEVASSGHGVLHTEKMRGPVSAGVELVGSAPERAGDVFVLRGVISTRRRLSNVAFQWAVPKGVELVNGEVSGVISALAPGQDFVAQVTLRSLVDGNSQIHLSVNGGLRPGARFGDTAQFNTVTQQFLESKARLLKSAAGRSTSGSAKSKKKGSESVSEPDYKVFH